jgi:hypothetical protein
MYQIKKYTEDFHPGSLPEHHTKYIAWALGVILIPVMLALVGLMLFSLFSLFLLFI